MFLRAMSDEDLETILLWRNDPSVRKNMYTHHVIQWEEHRAWFERVCQDITRRDFIYSANGRPYGVVCFTELDSISRNGFWGFYSDPAAPPVTGIAMEYLALNMAFSELNLHKLNCEVLDINPVVVNMHKKVGFTIEGTFREAHFNGERYCDIIRFGMLAHEWTDGYQERLKQRLQKFVK
jgi:UDP-4-amino-4,6-dideoxy-N-acetyl-beta-L-altrosamine N-acetyltransferase